LSGRGSIFLARSLTVIGMRNRSPLAELGSRHTAQAHEIARRFRAKALPRKATLLDEDRTIAGRVALVRVEDLGDDKIRATVAIRHKWIRRDFELPGFVPYEVQRAAAALAHELVATHADVTREWTWGAAWLAEGTRRMDCPCGECAS